MRRRAILVAAAELVAEDGIEAVSLSAIARRSRLAKSNLYRYFESREHILLALMLDDWGRWSRRVERGLAALGQTTDIRGGSDAVASEIARAFGEEVRLCALTSMLHPVLMRDLSVVGRVAFERDLADHGKRVSRALRGVLPALSQAERAIFLRAMIATVAGTWPMRRANDDGFIAELARSLRAQLQATAVPY